MKRGQLLSQPLFYVFAIIVIGMTLVFGFYMINKLLDTGCKVENVKFVADIRENVQEIYSVGFSGSSKKCLISSRASDSKCNILMPSGIKGMCFVDATKGDYSGVDIKEIREELESLEYKDRNLFFVSEKENCELNSVKLNHVDINEPFCIRKGESKNILIENKGRNVEIKEI